MMYPELPQELSPPKRRRFQFSLRILLFVVVGYGLLWLIALKVGGKELSRHYADIYKDDNPTIDADGSLVIKHRKISYIAPSLGPTVADISTLQYKGHVICPAPFVVAWKWESLNEKKETGFSDDASRFGPDYYLWFFGYRKTLGIPVSPYVW